jgi:hypothetical protein
MQTDPTAAITTTAACDTFRHDRCRGVVLSLTDAHGAPCRCQCHGSPVVKDLPAAFAELVFLTPPCDQDVDLAPIEDDELDELLELEGDRLLELDAESRLFGVEL